MSRVGKNPVEVPSGVTVGIKGSQVTVKGGKGELQLTLAQGIEAKLEGQQVLVSRSGDEKEARALHGTMRSLIANMVEGVDKGFKKELEIQGVGFRGQLQGTTLILALGYSHPIEFPVPEGLNIELPDPTKIIVSGVDKQAVGQASARIRSYFPAEPYKGKGIRYKGEHVRRKAGKTVA